MVLLKKRVRGQSLAAVVLADRQRQVGDHVDREARLIAQDVGEVLLRRGRKLKSNSIIGSPKPREDCRAVLPAP